MEIATKPRTVRIQAIDIFRALIMTLMITVNEFGTVIDLPHWMHHADTYEDMLGLSDIVFPCFLFVMGMSLPYAIRNRKAKGDSSLQILMHVGIRTAAMLIMGVFMVNNSYRDFDLIPISREVYNLIMLGAFFLIWNVYPRVSNWQKYLFIGLRILGAILLIGLFIIFEGRDGEPFGIHWWGILGLLGWSYVYCAIAFALCNGKIAYAAIAWAFFIVCSMLSHTDMFAPYYPTLRYYMPDGGTLQSLTMGGVIASLILTKFSGKENFKKLILSFGGLAVVMFGFGYLSHQFWIISKNLATPTWMFYIFALSFVLFLVVYYITDIAGKGSWFCIIKPAGTSTLTCYLVPNLVYSVWGFIPFGLSMILPTGGLGILKCFVFALMCIWITWCLNACKIKLKI